MIERNLFFEEQLHVSLGEQDKSLFDQEQKLAVIEENISRQRTDLGLFLLARRNDYLGSMKQIRPDQAECLHTISDENVLSRMFTRQQILPKDFKKRMPQSALPAEPTEIVVVVIHNNQMT